MKRVTSFAVFVALFALGACADRQDTAAPDTLQYGFTAAEPITVLSRNMYLGANIDPLIDPQVPLEEGLALALGQLYRTDFLTRVPRLAGEIAARMPHVVGLQEVSRYDMITGAGVQTLDYLQLLMMYLAGMGADYEVAAYQPNVSLMLPGIPPLLGITYTDGDAILVRGDVQWKDATSGHFANQVGLSVMGHDFWNLRGWNAVTVNLQGRWHRFVNAHLEIQAFRPYQEQQAAELIEMLRGEPLPIIMVGDFNSAANHDAPVESRTDSYHMFRNAGFADLWLREPHSVGGLTCCQSADLTNATSEHDQRLDIVFVRDGRAGFGGRSQVEVFGNEPFAHPAGGWLWPSDHAGIFAALWHAPGRMKQ
jgi:endonuclease/exonuclease/phosphatase family metal-dependent hydrolase